MTNEADKMICCMYKEYLNRVATGSSKTSSRVFTDEFFTSDALLSTWHRDDIRSTQLELNRMKYLKENILGEIELTPDTIEYMQNRFKSGISAVTGHLIDLAKDVATGLIL